jgi:AraC family transcriptional regulator of adaptative response/methylated-DNA-[protein]-cysteine methyltransferase
MDSLAQPIQLHDVHCLAFDAVFFAHGVEELEAPTCNFGKSQTPILFHGSLPASDLEMYHFIYASAPGVLQKDKEDMNAFQQDPNNTNLDNSHGEDNTEDWRRELEHHPDDRPMLDPTGKSLDAAADMYFSDVPFPWDTSFDFTDSFSAPANQAISVGTPALVESSTPTSFLSSAVTSPSIGVPCRDFLTDIQRWHATESRSRAADHAFLYGVLTTKIFCRPSCASRRPSRRHVRFFPFPGAIEDAEDAKLRACKRCKPELLGTVNTGVLGICQVLRKIIAGTFNANTKNPLKLDSLATSAGLSSFHFHRLFKATTQVTPGDFIQACRAMALQDVLGKDCNTEVDAVDFIKKSSQWSPRTARKALGNLFPTEYGKGAPSTNIEYCRVDTPAGLICAACSMSEDLTEASVHAVLLGLDSEDRMRLRFPHAEYSVDYENCLQVCVQELEKEGRDRDTELTADVLSMLWKARIWLKLSQYWGK